MSLKSERLRKLEAELADLDQWLTLGLVPKKELAKHKEEIHSLKDKIQEEKERLRLIKESGEVEEFVAPKRTPGKQVYAEPQTLPDMDLGVSNTTDVGLDMETETFDVGGETVVEEEVAGEEAPAAEEEEEDPFSDKNRWKRGILEDPDADNW